MQHMIKSTVYITISNIFTRFFVLIFYIILARVLSINDYGLFRYLLTISFIYSIAFTGVPTALSKYLSNKKNAPDYISGTIFIMSAVFFVIVVIIMFQQYSIFLIFLVFSLLIDSFYLGFVRGLLNYYKLAGYKLLENILQLLILVVAYVLYKRIDFTFAIVFYSFSGIISLVIFESFKYELKFRFTLAVEKLKNLIKYTIPVTLGSIGWMIMFGITTIFIKYFYNSEQVAFFSAGDTISQVFSLLPSAIAIIALPAVAIMKDKSKILKPLLLAVAGTIISSIVILIFLLLFKRDIITLAFTDRYIPALIVILPLSIGQICISLHQIYASVLQGMGKPGIPSITISIAAFLNIIGSYFLTKSFGIMGAAISDAIASIIALTLITLLFYKNFNKWKKVTRV